MLPKNFGNFIKMAGRLRRQLISIEFKFHWLTKEFTVFFGKWNPRTRKWICSLETERRHIDLSFSCPFALNFCRSKLFFRWSLFLGLIVLGWFWFNLFNRSRRLHFINWFFRLFWLRFNRCHHGLLFWLHMSHNRRWRNISNFRFLVFTDIFSETNYKLRSSCSSISNVTEWRNKEIITES